MFPPWYKYKSELREVYVIHASSNICAAGCVRLFDVLLGNYQYTVRQTFILGFHLVSMRFPSPQKKNLPKTR